MYRQKKQYGQDPTVVKRSSDATFKAPLRWKKPALVFTCSWSDFFHPDADAWREEAWDVIHETPHLTYQILTKRPERILDCLPVDWGQGWKNVWLGVTAENQGQADRRIPILLQVPAAVRWVSIEPMLGPVDLRQVPNPDGYLRATGRTGVIPDPLEGDDYVWATKHFLGLNWVVVGGESGGPPERRLVEKNPILEIPMVEVDGEMYGVEVEMLDPNSGGDGWRPKPTALEWVRSIRDQCQVAEVAFFLKGWGGPRPTSGGHLLDGREWREFPGKKGA